MFWLGLATSFAVKNSDPLITQELVDQINNNPLSSFKATLYPKFAQMTVGEAKKFLSPIRKSPSKLPGSPRPVGVDEKYFNHFDKRVLTGFYTTGAGTVGERQWGEDKEIGKYKYVVYDNHLFCSSWATAVTSAMSLAISIHHRKFVNLSVQFIMDCDILGDPCVERPPLNSYEQFWRRYIPQSNRWDQPSNVLRTPYQDLTKAICAAKDGCYPGWASCPRNLVMTGSCEPEEDDTHCPIYFLYNWRRMKAHLWEVGPVTSTILVTQSLFAYSSGVYTIPTTEPVIGMLDVTIIGWGQQCVNLSRDAVFHTGNNHRWWYVIPHLGTYFGETCESIFGSITAKNAQAITSDIETESIVDHIECPGSRSGLMRFNRRFDDSHIETNAVGAVPFNFRPMAYKTPNVKPNM